MERSGVVTVKGNGVTLLGPAIGVGDEAPDFTVVDKGLKEAGLKDFAGKVKIISVTPSLDTPVCDAQVRRFNDEASKLGDDVAVINISMDLPFAISRFCTTAGIEKVQSFSDHRDASFGQNYGVLIKELRLHSRAIFIVGKDDKLAYVEIVPEMTDNPDFDAAMAAAKGLLGGTACAI